MEPLIIDFSIAWTPIVIGVASSLVASIIFFTGLFAIRPSYKISPIIAKTSPDEDGKDRYVFKVINRSPLFKIQEFRYSMEIYKRNASPNGEDLKRTDLEVSLNSDISWSLQPFNIRHISQWLKSDRKLKTRSDYAIQFSTEHNLKALLSENKIIRVYASGKHPYSGFVKIKSEDYRHHTEIHDGAFCSGNSFSVKC